MLELLAYWCTGNRRNTFFCYFRLLVVTNKRDNRNQPDGDAEGGLADLLEGAAGGGGGGGGDGGAST